MPTVLVALSTLALLWTLQQPPATDVFLADLARVDGRWTVGKPINISASPGYDNQPFFTPDGGALLFTSARGPVASACGKPQTDIYRYDMKSRTVSQVTSTPECEYSPTVTPTGDISVVRVEADGTQRLWRFTADGRNPSLVLAGVKPVGYHAWMDANTVALFVLGQPATLQIADAITGKTAIVARDIGQSMARIPGGGVSFVQQAGERGARTLTVTQLSVQNGTPQTKRLTAVVAGASQAHLAWGPEGTLFMAHDGWLHAWRQGTTAWERVADLNALGLRTVTRLAVSPGGDRLALVAHPE